MKKIIFTVVAAFAALVSCDSMLQEESRTSITAEWLKTTPAGLSRMVTALYERDREMNRDYDSEGTVFQILNMDCCTDIMVFNSGNAAMFARLSPANSSSSGFLKIWKHYYSLIGKANEVIVAAENLGLDDAVTKKAWAEAKVFRARSYFELYKRYERLYLNLVPTGVDNISRDFRPSSKKDIFKVIKDDLDDAIEVLPWTDQPGRYHKAVAKHIRAQVAMWDDDYDTAIEQCEDIFEDGTYGLMPRTIDCFIGADLVCKENLCIYPFSDNIGGGNSVSGSGTLNGNRVSLLTTPRYYNVAGMTHDVAYGGYGWGRQYPNSYLLGLYGPKDKRYDELFIHKFYYNDPNANYEQISKDLTKELGYTVTVKLGDEVIPRSGSEYFTSLHPYYLKYADLGYTNADMPSRTSSYKDVVLYRLAETYLMCAEAYYHKEGGGSANAKKYFNKTYMRAGNDEFTGTLRMQDLLDEYARECHMEGVRWQLLKRLGLLERVAIYGGDLPVDDPKLRDVSDKAQMRTYWHEKWYCWPIPQSEIDFMGVENFPQNEGWL